MGRPCLLLRKCSTRRLFIPTPSLCFKSVGSWEQEFWDFPLSRRPSERELSQAERFSTLRNCRFVGAAEGLAKPALPTAYLCDGQALGAAFLPYLLDQSNSNWRKEAVAVCLSGVQMAQAAIVLAPELRRLRLVGSTKRQRRLLSGRILREYGLLALEGEQAADGELLILDGQTTKPDREYCWQAWPQCFALNADEQISAAHLQALLFAYYGDYPEAEKLSFLARFALRQGIYPLKPV